MDLVSQPRPTDLRRSIRTIGVSPHLGGGFPSSLTASWCVREGALHEIVLPGQAEVALGSYIRPVVWPELEADWKTGTLSAGGYLKILVDPDLVPLVHNQVASEEPSQRALVVPPGLTATLYPYQIAGFAKMAGVVSGDIGALLCDEMGLGKTVQAIALLLDQASRGQSLVVAPSSLLTNWQRELAAFAPGLSVLRHTGGGRAGVASGLAGWDLIVTSYDTAINDVTFLRDIPWNVMVLDEAQRIKNADTTRSQVIKSLPRRATVCVTGTPVENSLTDLWSLSEASLPPLLGSLDRFQSIYRDDAASAVALGRIVAPITVRRSVEDVAGDLPPLLAEDIAIDMEAPLRNLYDSLASSGRLADITVQRTIAAHGHEDLVADLEGSAKGDVTLQMLGEAFDRREKALVFASFSRSLDRLEAMVRSARSDAYLAIVDGRKAPDERQKIIDEFTDHLGPGALFMNPRAAGEGLNIVAANHVIHFNPEWNPATTKQATARAYRRKQTLPVFVHHLYYANSIEDDAMDRQARKAALAESLAAGHAEQD